MAHFAELDINNLVISVIVISNDDIIDKNGEENEQLGINLCNTIVRQSRWIQTSINNSFRKQFAQVGFKYDAVNDIFIAPQPFDWYILDSEFNWVCPNNVNPEDGTEYSVEELNLAQLSSMLEGDKFSFIEDAETGQWLYECRTLGDRKSRTFHIWNAQSTNENYLYGNACSSNNYSIQSMEKLTHGIDSISKLVIDTNSQNPETRYPKIAKHFVVLDLSPFALITYQEFAETDHVLFTEAMRIHPQCATRSIEELFRLIIEWAWSYTELDNHEPMAELCHNILRALQMPLDVRNDLLGMRPQPVARFLSGDPNSLDEYIDSETTPTSFKAWISDTYQTFKERKINDPLNLNLATLLTDYPV